MVNKLKLISAVLVGIVFGLALEKGRVFEPSLIRDQMLWRNFAMLKMFLCACLGSLISMSILYIIARPTFASIRKTRGHIAQVIVGCSLLGIGMAVSGACPGTILAQLGSGVTFSIFTLLGGIIAALVFTKFKDQIVKPFQKDFGIPRGFLDEILSIPFHFLAIPLAGILFLIVAALEYAVPWYSDYQVDQLDYFPSVYAVAWPPYYSGIIIGLLQLPAILFVSNPLGCSTPYEILASHIHKKAGTCKSNYVRDKCTFSFGNIWGFFFLFGAMGGAFISSSLSGSFHTASSVSVPASFFGGFLIIFGSRLARGCTSGHGISGFSSLSVDSLFSVPAMFVCGTFVAFGLFE